MNKILTFTPAQPTPLVCNVQHSRHPLSGSQAPVPQHPFSLTHPLTPAHPSTSTIQETYFTHHLHTSGTTQAFSMTTPPHKSTPSATHLTTRPQHHLIIPGRVNSHPPPAPPYHNPPGRREQQWASAVGARRRSIARFYAVHLGSSGPRASGEPAACRRL